MSKSMIQQKKDSKKEESWGNTRKRERKLFVITLMMKQKTFKEEK